MPHCAAFILSIQPLPSPPKGIWWFAVFGFRVTALRLGLGLVSFCLFVGRVGARSEIAGSEGTQA